MVMTGRDMVERSYLRVKWEADEDRMSEAASKMDIYSDDYEDIIDEALTDLFVKENRERLRVHINQSQNVLKRVVNKISTIYKEGPQRQVKPRNARFDQLAGETKIDVKMRKVNRYANLLNECLVKVGIRGGKIVYDIITPNICMVIQNEEDPTKADAVIYLVAYVDSRTKPDFYYHYWSVDGDYYVFDKEFRLKRIVYEGDGSGEGLPYPYREADGRFALPFAICHRQDPDGAFWDQDSGRDLYNAAVTIGWKMTLFDYYFKTCTIKQPYIIGDVDKIAGKQVSDPLTFFHAPASEGAQIGLLDMQINLDQLSSSIKFAINTIINNYGISSDQYSLEIPELSGRALKIMNSALLEIREEQLPLYREFEQDLFGKTRIVNNAFPKLFAKIPDNLEMTVDFAEMDFPEDPMDELELDTRKVKMGLIPLGSLYRKYNPDIESDEEGERILLENLKKLEEIKGKHPDLEAALNEILGAAAKERAPAAGPPEEGSE